MCCTLNNRATDIIQSHNKSVSVHEVLILFIYRFILFIDWLTDLLWGWGLGSYSSYIHAEFR